MSKEELVQRVEQTLDEVRPNLIVDGGNVKLVDITDDMEVLIEWEGTCLSCDMSEMTLRAGIAQSIKARLPEITSVKVAKDSDIGIDD